MHYPTWREMVLICSLFGCLTAGRLSSAQDENVLAIDEGKSEKRDDGPARPEAARDVFFFARGEESEFWLGLQCSKVGDALRTQLDLPKDQGLLVEGVLPESPAQKAGIKRFDVLLSAAEKPLKEVSDLLRVVKDNQDKDISIKLMREGKTTTVPIKPEKRPSKDVLFRRSGNGDAVWDLIQGRDAGDGPIRMKFFHPGMVLPPGVADHASIPEDMTITITKTGSKPAKIEVKQKDQTWNTTEDKLSELPEGVRPHVEGMLGRLPFPGPMKFQVRIPGPTEGAGNEKDWSATPDVKPFTGPAPPGSSPDRDYLVPRRPAGPEQPGSLERKLDDINRSLRSMRRELDELRERSPRRGGRPSRERSNEDDDSRQNDR